MLAVEVYAAVRHFVFVEGNSQRAATRVFGLSRETISKMCRFSLPPGYTRVKPVAKPKLGALLPVIDAIPEADGAAPVKRRHFAKRSFERLCDEHGYAGGQTVVKDQVRIDRGRLRETFVPLAHPPGHAQVDFGESVGMIGGVRQKIHFFWMNLPHSDACFAKAYPAETTEAFLDGHLSAFAFFGELAGWLEGMQRDSSGGSDRPFRREAFGGRGFTVERMGRDGLNLVSFFPREQDPGTGPANR